MTDTLLLEGTHQMWITFLVLPKKLTLLFQVTDNNVDLRHPRLEAFYTHHSLDCYEQF